MKYNKGFIAIILCLIILSGCTPAASPSDIPVNSSGAYGATQGDKLELLTNVKGVPFGPSAGVDGGFHEIITHPEGGGNIVYTDFATQTRVFLCNKPECKHNNENCTSWLPNHIGGSWLFFNTAKTKMFYIQPASPMDELPNALVMMDINGANRKVLLELQPNEELVDSVLSDKDCNYLLITVTVFNEEKMERSKELRRFDIKTGNIETLHKFPFESWVFGAVDDNIVFLHYRGNSEEGFGEYIYTFFSPFDKTEKEFYTYSTSGNGPITEPYKDELYIVDGRGDGTGFIKHIGLKTGQEQILVDSIPFYSIYTTGIDGFYDNYMLLHVTDTRENDPLKVKRYRYAINLETGAVTPVTLQYFYYEDTEVRILSSTKDHFLVINGSKSTTITLYGNDNIPYEMEAEVPQYALILKTDFWANNANYIHIQDTAVN